MEPRDLVWKALLANDGGYVTEGSSVLLGRSRICEADLPALPERRARVIPPPTEEP